MIAGLTEVINEGKNRNIAIGSFKEELMNNVYEMNIDKLNEIKVKDSNKAN